MKLSLKATVVAVAFGLVSGANAAIIDDTITGGANGADIVVMIENQAAETLIVNTNLASADLFSGAVTSYASDTALTASINSFLAGSTSARFYVSGAVQNGIGATSQTIGLLTRSSSLNSSNDTLVLRDRVNSFASFANFGEFGSDAAGDGPDIENVTGIANLDFNNPNGVFNFATTGSLDAALTMKAFDLDFNKLPTPFSELDLGDWTLASNGALSYSVSAVPVPAAVWLFGSGLMGLVGVARRRRAS